MLDGLAGPLPYNKPFVGFCQQISNLLTTLPLLTAGTFAGEKSLSWPGGASRLGPGPLFAPAMPATASLNSLRRWQLRTAASLFVGYSAY